MIENRKKRNYYNNWRSVNEKAIYALVGTAIKRANNKLDNANIPSPTDIKELYIASEDYRPIHMFAESVLRSLKTYASEHGGKIENIETVLRKQVLQSMNNMIATKINTSKTFQPRELQRNVQYATEQIERARELGFEDVAEEMEYRLKLIFNEK
jgi:hypothetical protein